MQSRAQLHASPRLAPRDSCASRSFIVALRPASIQYEGQGNHGIDRLSQHHHPVRRRAGARRHHVEPGGAALRRAVAARVPPGRHAGRRIRRRRHQVRRRAAGLYGRLGGARPDPVRRRAAHAARDLPQRARPRGPAGHCRRPDHGGADRAGRGLGAATQLERGAAGWRRDGLDRRRGGVLPAARQGAAAAAARQRHARGRIRHQRSVRDLYHHRAGRDPAVRQQTVGRHRCIAG